MAQATASSQSQKILQPVLVFSNRNSQRGTTHTLGVATDGPAAGAAPVAKDVREKRSVNTALDMQHSFREGDGPRVPATVAGGAAQSIGQPRDLWRIQSATHHHIPGLPGWGQLPRLHVRSILLAKKSIRVADRNGCAERIYGKLLAETCSASNVRGIMTI